MDIVDDKIKLYTPIIELFHKHAKDIKLAFGKKRSVSLHRIAALIRQFKEIALQVLARLGEGGTPATEAGVFDSPHRAFEAVDSASIIEMTVAEIYDLVNFDAVDAESEMSQTFSLNINASLKNIVAAYTAAISLARVNDDRLMSTALAAIDAEQIEDVERLYAAHGNAIGLYIGYIQRRIDDLRPESHEYAEVMSALDRAKTDVMRRVRVSDGGVQREESEISARLQRFGLVPIFQHLPPDEIYRRVTSVVAEPHRHEHAPRRGGGDVTERGGALDLMATLFAEQGVGVYVMIRVTSTQIEYDFRPLIDKKVAVLYSTPTGCGVNASVIKKFEVIKNVSRGGGRDVQDIKMGNLEAKKWVVVRTINGVDYDVMARGGTDSVYVSRDTIEGLWRGASIRVANYQGVCATALAKHIKIPREVGKEKVTPLQGVANQVRMDVMRYVDEKLAVEVPTSLRGLAEFISGGEIENITSKVLISSYTSESVREMLPTFLYSVDSVLKKFTRKIRESFAMSDMTEFMFVELVRGALVNHIRTKLADIVGGAASMVFDSNQDIYAVLYVKEKILKVEL